MPSAFGSFNYNDYLAKTYGNSSSYDSSNDYSTEAPDSYDSGYSSGADYNSYDLSPSSFDYGSGDQSYGNEKETYSNGSYSMYDKYTGEKKEDIVYLKSSFGLGGGNFGY